MRLGRVCGAPLRLNPLALPMAALALWLGEGERLAAMSLAVLLHELGHLCAARLAGAQVLELELLPFGGALRLGDLWLLRPSQAALVALAGPCASFVLASASALWLRVTDAGAWQAALFLRANGVVLLFNLLPALPLDGGRALCALLDGVLGPNTASRVGVWLGRALALALLALSAASAFRGAFNVTYALSGAFLLVSSRREAANAQAAPVVSLASRALELRAEGALPMRMIAVREDADAREAARLLRARKAHLFVTFDAQMRATGYFTEGELLETLLAGGRRVEPRRVLP